MELSVVVPVHNEEDNIQPLVAEIVSHLAEMNSYEIIYVDDGSSDKTREKLCMLKNEFKQLRVLHHAKCCGQSTSLRTGILAANGKVIATLDGDGQNDPKDIPSMLSLLNSLSGQMTKTMIVGNRKNRKDSEWRRFSSKVANHIRGTLLKDNTPDTGCGLKVFHKDLFISLPYFDHMHRFLPALAQRAGATVKSVEVNHRPRTNGQSKYGTWNRLWVGIWDLCGVIWLIKRSHIPKVTEL